MTLSLDLPQAPASPLGRLDPRWKLAALLGAAILIAPVQTPLPALIAWAGALLLAVLGRLPARWFTSRLIAGLALPAFFALWLPFTIREGQAVHEVVGITVSAAGTQRAVALVAKAGCIITLVLIVLATAPLQDTFKAAHALRMPGWLVHLVLMTYRYAHLLGDEFGRLRVALRVRGYRNRAGLHSYRTIGHVAGTLLVRGHERSERVAEAMRCRAFDGRFRSLHTFRARAADGLFLAAVLGLAASLLAWDLLS